MVIVYFARLVPRHEAEVVRAAGIAAPFVVGRHHEEPVLVVAALLTAAVTTETFKKRASIASFACDAVKLFNLRGQTGPVAHDGTLVVGALGVAVAVALVVGHVAALVGGGLVHHARADGQLVAERAHAAVVVDPAHAPVVRPLLAVEALPLRVEVPAQRYRSAPQDPAIQIGLFTLRFESTLASNHLTAILRLSGREW